MKKILALIISISVIILLGVAFGLGALPAAYYPAWDVSAKQIGNYYAITWQYLALSNQYTETYGAVMNQVTFFLLCLSSLLAIVVCVPFKKRPIVDGVLSVMLLATGVLLFFVPYFFVVGSPQTDIGLGGGLVAMAILVLVAGALNVFKTVLGVLDKKEQQ